MTSRLLPAALALLLSGCFNAVGEGPVGGQDGGMTTGGGNGAIGGGTAGGNGATGGGNGVTGDGGPTGGGATGSVVCGTSTCSADEFCVWPYVPGGPRGAPRCVARGMERSLESPFGNLLAYCDNSDDCGHAMACVHLRGEDDRVECVDDQPQVNDCFHSAHVCLSDSDCHACSGRQARCTGSLAPLPLRFCSFL